MKKALAAISAILLPAFVFASNETAAAEGIAVAGIRLEFIIFALTLVGVALFHNRVLQVAITGLLAILVLKFTTTDFDVLHHLEHEWEILVNLFGLLLGFAVLAKHFEDSGIPDNLPKILPSGWKGAFALLVLIFIMSAFLDNIAAAIIGGSIGLVIFRGNVHIGFLAAMVAASNAGGAGSVVGDTTTTMMWIAGVPIIEVLPAFIAATPALIVFGLFAARQQDKHQPVIKDLGGEQKPINTTKLLICVLILIGAVTTNVLLDFPAAGVWAAILIGALFSKTPWKEIPEALPGALFLLSLVLAASMMPVDQLPGASWQTAFILGFVSSIFDNIPLTKLAIQQDGYDWGLLAYAVGYGGSMVWFGSSAGVALSNLYPQAKSVGQWVRHGWHVILAYVIGFFIMLAILGWNPDSIHSFKGNDDTEQTEQTEAHH